MLQGSTFLCTRLCAPAIAPSPTVLSGSTVHPLGVARRSRVQRAAVHPTASPAAAIASSRNTDDRGVSRCGNDLALRQQVVGMVRVSKDVADTLILQELQDRQR